MMTVVPAPPFTRWRKAPIEYAASLTADSATDEAGLLASRLAQRDEDALKEAYELYSRPVFSFLLRFTGDRPAAEDIQQQVFMEAWQKADRFDPDRGSMLSWLMTIARSRAIDQARRRVPEPHDPTAAADLAGAGPSGNDGHDGIDEVIENWQFMQILGRLPSDEAELLRFRFQGELSQAEIADRTGIPLGTVKSRMVSALTRLKGMMEAES